MSNRTLTSTHLPALAVILHLLLISACGLGMDNTERLERALGAFQSADYRAASIDAKTILQQEPDNVQARLLLGRASLALNDGAAAESELRRAIGLGTPVADVAIELGEALLLQGKYESLLEDLQPDEVADSNDRTRILLLRGNAHMGLGLFGTARTVFSEALDAEPANTDAQLGIASSYSAQEDYAAASESIARIFDRQPDHIPAWLLSASIELNSQNPDSAAASYTKAIELAEAADDQPNRLAAVSGLIEAQLARRDIPAAKQALGLLRDTNPDSLETQFLEARIAYIDGDYDAAHTAVQDLLRDAPNYLPARLLIGAVQLSRGNLAQADAYISEVVTAVPDNQEARALLAQVRVQQGRAAEVPELLAAANTSDGISDSLVGVAIRASLQSGDYATTIAYLRQRLAANPDNPDASLELAATLITAGEVDEAEVILERLPEGADSNAFEQQLLQIYVTLQRQDAQTALSLAEQLVAQHPDDARAYSAVANVALLTGDATLARSSLAEAQRRAPQTASTYLNIAAIDIERGEFDSARAQLRALLEQQPDSPQFMTALALLEQRAGNDPAAEEWLERALSADPESVAPRISLAQWRLNKQDYVGAEDTARSAVELAGDNAVTHNLLGLALYAQDKLEPARASLERALELAPNEAAFRSNLANVFAASGDFQGAERALTGGGAIDLNDMNQVSSVAQFRLRAGNADAAHEVVEQAKALNPANGEPYGIEGELALATGDLAGAVRAFDQAIGLNSNDRRLAMRAYDVRRTAQSANPERVLTQFLDENPRDVGVRLVLAQHYASAGERSRAIRQYEICLQAAPNSASIMNNLAWEYFQARDSRAELLARRAYEQQPNNSDIADTLGWVLVKDGQFDEGISVLRTALENSADSPIIKYHLAAGLAEKGQTSDARALLSEALASTSTFPGRGDAEQLLAELQ